MILCMLHAFSTSENIQKSNLKLDLYSLCYCLYRLYHQIIINVAPKPYNAEDATFRENKVINIAANRLAECVSISPTANSGILIRVNGSCHP